MADVQISDLPSDTTVVATDLFLMQDGSTGDAKQVTAANLLAPGTVSPEKLQTGAGTSWAWQSYTTIWTASTTNPTIGNGTIVAYYQQSGKTIRVKIALTFGSTTTAGSGVYRFSLPANASTNGVSQMSPFGIAAVNHTGGVVYTGQVYYDDPTRITIRQNHITGSVVDNNYFFAHNDPIAWASGDTFNLSFEYEAA